jgi:Kef-type K+ transport system membrane component KefB
LKGAEFGFTFLMFLSGLEVSIETLFAAAAAADQRPYWQRPLPLAGLCFLATILLAFLVGLGLSQLGLARQPLLLGLILSTTSLGIVVPVLKERGLTATEYGQVVLATALLSDFVTLLLLSLLIAVISQGPSLDLLLFLALLAMFAVATKLGQWVSRIPGLTRISAELSHATGQIQVRGALALMVSWVVLAEALGVEVILGAFLAGVIVSLSSRNHESVLHEKLDALGYGFFIPLFFILVGANFDLWALLESYTALMLVPLLLAAAYLIKMLPALLYRARFSWSETLGAGALLSSRLSLIIATSAIALQLGIITSATNAAIVLVAVVTCTLSPLLFA